MKVFFAIPCHRATDEMIGILANRCTSIARGIPAELSIVSNCPWLDAARADLVAKFLLSNSTHLFFIDDDEEIESVVLKSMIERDAPIVIVPYRKRFPPHDWAVKIENKEIIAAGLGCTLIKREVIERMIDDFPELTYEQDGRQQHNLFLHVIDNNELLKEDHAFFHRAAQCGFRITPIEATINHNGIISTWEALS